MSVDVKKTDAQLRAEVLDAELAEAKRIAEEEKKALAKAIAKQKRDLKNAEKNAEKKLDKRRKRPRPL